MWHTWNISVNVSILFLIFFLIMFAPTILVDQPGDAAEPESVYCTDEDRPLQAEELPSRISVSACSLTGRLVLDQGGIGAYIPPLGQGVTIQALHENGTELLDIDVDGTGTIVVDYTGSERELTELPGNLAYASSDTSACDDSRAHFRGEDWTETMDWFRNSLNDPNNLTAAQISVAQEYGITTITLARNPCGLPDRVSATQDYRGLTSRRASLTLDTGTCAPSGDGVNVVEFGGMASNPTYVGVACIRRSSGDISETDARLDSRRDWFVGTNVPPGCSDQWQIESIMAHEAGHMYGLLHVSEADYPWLTMSANPEVCDRTASNLGLGDILGLEAKY